MGIDHIPKMKDRLLKPLLFLIVFISMGCATTPLTKPSYSQRKTYIVEKDVVGAEIRNAILEGKVIPGMHKSEVIASWGRPTEIFKPSNNEKEMWYFRGLGPLLEPGKRVFFVDDKVDHVYVSEN